MKAISPGLVWLNELIISNVWLFRPTAGDVVLIDTGHAVERSRLFAALRGAGISQPGDLSAVLLTHRHSDHAGNALALKRHFGCKVMAHPLDAPFLDGTRRPPKMLNRSHPLAHQAMCWMEDHFPSRCPVDVLYKDKVDAFGLRVVPVHGHTEGSVMLFHEPSGTLFSGDAIIVGIPPLRFPRRPLPAVPFYAQNLSLCDGQVLDFLKESPAIERLCAGHGPALDDHLSEHLAGLKERIRARGAESSPESRSWAAQR